MFVENIGKFLTISTLIIACCNLIGPFLGSEKSRIWKFSVVFIAIIFFLNLTILDFLFFEGMRVSVILASFRNYSLELHIEGLGMVFLNLLGLLWIISLIYTIRYLKLNHIEGSRRFLFFLNLSVISGIFIALSANLITMFIFYEMLTLASAPLIVHAGGEKGMKALSKYLKTLALSSIFLFLPAMLIIITRLGNINFIYGGFLEDKFTNLETSFLLIAVIFGLAKSSVFPLHSWLPGAMAATYPVSALLHAVVVVKAGLFCTFKILLCVFGLSNLHNIFGDFNWILLFPAFTILYSSYKALRTGGIKPMLAYSTIGQLNLALLAAFIFTPKGLGAGIIHMVSHSFSKISLFFAAGNFYSFKKTNDLEDLSSANTSMPKTSLFFLISSLSLVGFPPLAGFISKIYIIVAAAEENKISVILLVALSSLLSGIYFSRILLCIYKPNKIEPKNSILKVKESANSLTLFACGAFVIFFFILTKLISNFLINIK